MRMFPLEGSLSFYSRSRTGFKFSFYFLLPSVPREEGSIELNIHTCFFFFLSHLWGRCLDTECERNLRVDFQEDMEVRSFSCVPAAALSHVMDVDMILAHV